MTLFRFFAAAAFVVTAIATQAQPWTQLQWGINKSAAPYVLGLNNSGAWYQFLQFAPGTSSFTMGLNTSLFGGALQYTSQPIASYIDLIVPHDGAYHDNAFTMENDSVDPVTGACGNAALRFRDSVVHRERGAIGYSRVNTGCVAGYFINNLYIEIGNINSSTDPDDTSHSVINTHSPGHGSFPVGSYEMTRWDGKTGDIYFNRKDGQRTATYTEATNRFSFVYGLDIGVGYPVTTNYVTIAGGATGVAPSYSAVGPDTNIGLTFSTKGVGGVAYFTGGGLQFFLADTPSAVNHLQVSGGATGIAPYVIALGSDTNIGITFGTKGTGGYSYFTGGGLQLVVADTPSAANYMRISGGTNPSLSVSGGSLSFNSPTITGYPITSLASTGTAPFVVSSTTLVANLHVATADALTAVAWSAWTPTVTSQTGTIGTVTVNRARYTQAGSHVTACLDITITGGSGTGDTYATLPVTSKIGVTAGAAAGREIVGSNQGLNGIVDGVNNRMAFALSGSATAAAAGYRDVLCATYEAN